jgi:3'-phosphoadenosine 5'-phosphosulfate sulfotransferase (PAPS reductase)/FAD synthetase
MTKKYGDFCIGSFNEEGWNAITIFFREPETHIIADFDSVITQFTSRWHIKYFDVMLDEPSHQQAAAKWEAVNNKTGVFMGFARHESKARRYTTAKADKYNIYQRNDGFCRSTPLRLWSDMDIAAYTALHSLPMLSIYHRFGFAARSSAGVEMGTADNPDHSEIGFDQLTNEQRYRILDSQRRRKNVT